jgi:hypothetical protein
MLNKSKLCKMWKAKQKNAFHISHSHDGGYGIYPNAKTKDRHLHKIFDTSHGTPLLSC